LILAKSDICHDNLYLCDEVIAQNPERRYTQATRIQHLQVAWVYI